MGIACFTVQKNDKERRWRNVTGELREWLKLGGEEIALPALPAPVNTLPVVITAAPADPTRNVDAPVSPVVLNAVPRPTPMTGANNPTLRPMNSPPPRVASPRSAIQQWRRQRTWSKTVVELFWSPPSYSSPPSSNLVLTPLPARTASTMGPSKMTMCHQERERWDPTRKRRDGERESVMRMRKRLVRSVHHMSRVMCLGTKRSSMLPRPLRYVGDGCTTRDIGGTLW